MIITKTPFRVSLFGGSTDYPSFYEEEGSVLIGFCIDKYCYISLRKTPSIFPYLSHISYAKAERVENNSDIEHNGVRGVTDYLGITHGIELSHVSDLPAQTGIGSSSSFVVGLLKAFYTLQNKSVSRRELALQAIYIERHLLGEPGGVQDQIWAAYGGFNSIEIDKDGSFAVKPMPVSDLFKKELLERSVLLYTGKTRQSFKIAASHDNKLSKKIKKAIMKTTKSAYNSFVTEDIDSIGRLLHEGWERKKEISSSISNSIIDGLYENGLKHGGLGGKLLGTGGSGFLFFILDKGMDKNLFVKRMELDQIEFDFDNSGTTVINK